MADASFLKSRSAVAIALVGLFTGRSAAQTKPNVNGVTQNDQDVPNLNRVNQDELASFYGRMNVVVGSGARAFGMGGAFLARADDATAASWNPAGLSYLRRTEVSLVGVQNDFSQTTTLSGNATTGARNGDQLVDRLQGSVTDFVGAALPYRLNGRAGAVQVSYQRSFSFSGKRRSEGPGAIRGFANDRNVFPTEFTVEGDGGFDTISVSSGFEVNPRARIGVSINRWVDGFTQTVTRQSDVQNPNDFRDIRSKWDISGTNFNFGILVTPTEKLNVGAVIKTPFTARLGLAKDRTDPDPSNSSLRISNRSEGDVSIRFPRVYGLGVSYRVTNTLTFSADFTRTAWSKSTITNFFTLGKPDSGSGANSIDRFGALPFPAVENDTQADANQVRAGGEWVIRSGSSGGLLFPIRAGFFRDGQPFLADGRSPSFTGLTAGAGVTIGGLLFDVAFIREIGNVPVTGQAEPRKVRYNRLFASMIVRFGERR